MKKRLLKKKHELAVAVSGGYKMKELCPIEHDNVRVLTTQQLADVYKADVKNIHDNYANNKSRFVEGRDFYELKGEALKAFKHSLPDNIGEPLKFAPALILWTERGANRHSKILDTDQAWKQFDVLEETYFRVKNNDIKLPDFTNPAIAARAWADEVDKKLEAEKLLKQAEVKMIEQAPLVGFAEKCLKSSSNILVRELAKVISDEVATIGQNRLYELLREWKYIMTGKTEPYQSAIDSGLFVVKEGTIDTPYGTKITMTTHVTPLGQVRIVERFRKAFGSKQ